MPETQFRKGDLVSFRFATRFVQGEIKENRGPIGINGRHFYLVEFRLDPNRRLNFRSNCPQSTFKPSETRSPTNRQTGGPILLEPELLEFR